MDKTFSIYRSSAGSGKTRTLAKSYLVLALRHPDYFKYILAMTFTNKSTQEMKDRIIRYLDDFTQGKSEDLATEIREELAKQGKVFSVKDFQARSRLVLNLILHQYSQFSISTIDAFFQRVIRSFTRETGLMGNFKLEVENDRVLEEVVQLLMDQLTDNAALRGWIIDYAFEHLQEGKNWDIRSTLQTFSREIFTEAFKSIEEEVLAVTQQRSFFRDFKNRMQKEVYSFEREVKDQAQKLLADFQSKNFTVEDFKYGQGGSIYKYISTLIEGKIALPGARVLAMSEDPTSWGAPKSPNIEAVEQYAAQGWQQQLVVLLNYLSSNIIKYNSAVEVLKNLYVFGLVSDISRTLKEYLTENNLMLLSDAPHFLQGVMQDQDTSFVYEKVGSFFRHFLIDEFQDTSGYQWKNLLPLIRNGVAQNYTSSIVGDIKQSIYRWRGGDLNILQEQVLDDVGAEIISMYALDTNYRSFGNVVQFNNALFESASSIISAKVQSEFPSKSYVDAAQNIFRDANAGYVRVQFLETSEDEEGKKIPYEEVALQALPATIELLQERGVPLSDIAFLVRQNNEGQAIAQFFMGYSASPQAKPHCRYDVVSNESLRLDQGKSVVILINAMRILDNPEDMIAHANLAFEYQKIWPTTTFPDHHALFAQSKTKHFEKLVPQPFVSQMNTLSAFSLVEMVENLIHIFSLGQFPEEIPYLQAFEDLIFEFSMREKNDLNAFLEWWEEVKHKKSVQVAGGVDAAQIITIHKSKGLQFKYVIIPFLDWELNHNAQKAPILWCKSEEPLLKDVGYVPIKYKSGLAETYFKDFYQEEFQRIYLDNLNLLYVACTRAEEGLIAFSPRPKDQKNTVSHVGDLVHKAINDHTWLQTFWSDEDNTFQLGEINPSPSKQGLAPSLHLSKYAVSPWRERMSVKSQGVEFFEESERRKKINYGVFLHAIMARIYTESDVVPVLDRSMQQGLINVAERNILEENIWWIVRNPSLQVGFSGEGQVKTEATLVVPNGEKRIDRVVFFKDYALLIDYKTGKPNPKDEEQIREYASLLQQMGTSLVKGYLVYVEEQRCVSI